MIDRRRHPHGFVVETRAAPDGWPLRAFRWPAERPRGRLLFLGGRGDFFEKYLEALGHWRGKGWDVAGFDWRGQGGSGRLHVDPAVHHLDSLDPLVADLGHLLGDWLADGAGPHVVVAHSMGAHILLRALGGTGLRPAAAILSAPMIGIRAGRLETAAIGAIARSAVALGRSRHRLWRGDAGDIGGRMTSCPDRQADKLWWKTATPAIASGSPSWGWTLAACRSIAALTPDRLARIDVPILMLLSARDPIVSPAAAARAAAALPDARLELVPGTGHELLREADARRLPVLAAIDAFLAARTGAS